MSNPEVKIRLSLDGAQQVQAGVEQSAEKLLKLEKASADVASAQARLEVATQKAAAAQEALAKASNFPNTPAQYITDLQTKVTTATAAMQQASVRSKEAQAALAALGAGAGAAGQKVQLSGNQISQVSAQLQDFFVQVQGGQAPLTAFLQQGSQMSAVFGGVGNAARAMLSLLTPAVVGVGLLGGAVVGLSVAYAKGSAEAQEFNKMLILTGNQSAVTTNQLMDMAAAIRAAGNGTQGRAAEVLTQMAASGQIAAGNLQRFTAAALEMERVGGRAAEDTVKAFAELGKKPLEASLKLDESTNFLTASLYRQIKALEEQGNKAEAARVAQEAFFQATTSQTPALEKNLGSIERAWLGITTAIKKAGDALLNIGRKDTATSQADLLSGAIAAQERRIEQLQKLGAGKDTQIRLRAAEQHLESLRQQQAAAQSLAREEIKVANAQADSNEKKKAAVEADRLLEQLGIKQVSLKDQEKALTDALVKGGKDKVTIEKAIAELRERNKDKGAEKDAEKAKRELEEQRRLLAELSGVTSTYMEDLSRLARIRDKGLISEERYVELVRELMSKQPVIKKQLDAQAEATKIQAKAIEEVAKAYERQVEAAERSAQTVADQVDRMQLEEAASYALVDGKVTLEQAIQRLTVARLREKQAEQLRAGNQEVADSIKREIEQREKLLTLIEGKDARAAFDQQLKLRQQGIESIINSVDSTAQRVWTDVANGGQDAFKRVGNTIKASVLDLLYQLTIKKWVIGITANVLGVGGTAAGGVAGTLGAASNGLNLLNAGTAAAGIWGSSAAYGAAIGTTSIGAGSQAAMLAAQTGVFGAEGAAMTAAAAGNAAAGSMMSTIATAAPYVAAVLAVYSIAKSLDNSGTVHTGASSAYSAAQGLSTGAGLYGVGSKAGAYSTQTEALTSQISQSIVGILDSTATAFGKQAGFSAAAAFADDSSKDGAWGALAIRLGDQLVAGFGVQGNGKWPGMGFADGQAGSDQYLAAVSADVRSALNAIGIPEWAKSMLDKLGDAPALDTLSKTVAEINAIQATLGALGKSLPEIASLTSASVQKLVESFGGSQGLASALDSYYQSFYSEAERNAQATEQVTAALQKLGYTMPTTREQFRAWVDEQLKLGDAGIDTATNLLKLQGAVASLVPATEAATTAVDNLAEQMAATVERTVKQLTSQGDSLMVDLLTAQGDTAGAAALKRQMDLSSLLDGISGAGVDAITALYEKNQGIQGQLDALKKAASDQAAADQRAAAVATERTTLEGRLLQLQGDTAALRARELAGLDASNRAIQEHIYQLEDQQAAVQRLNGALSSLDSTYASQQIELLNAQGKSTEAAALKRATDLAGLTAGMNETDAARVTAAYDRNQAIQKEIDQTRAAQQAAEAIARAQEQAAETASRAAEQVRSAWQSASDTLFTEAARIRGLTTAESPASFAAAQASFYTTTAQARAGDQDAVKRLPELARLLEQVGKNQAGSQLELDRLRAAIAASLESTGLQLASTYGLNVPKLATGTNYVPKDMLAFLHEGEQVTPKAFNPAAGGGTASDELVREVKALREQVARLEASSGRTAKASEETKNVLVRVTEGGRAMQVENAS